MHNMPSFKSLKLTCVREPHPSQGSEVAGAGVGVSIFAQECLQQYGRQSLRGHGSISIINASLVLVKDVLTQIPLQSY